MNSEIMRTALAAAIIVLLGVILYMMSAGLLAGPQRDIAMVIIGVITSKFSGVYDFFFGSSDGSKLKDKAENEGE